MLLIELSESEQRVEDALGVIWDVNLISDAPFTNESTEEQELKQLELSGIVEQVPEGFDEFGKGGETLVEAAVLEVHVRIDKKMELPEHFHDLWVCVAR